jgi:hypothetical protein
VEKKLFFPGIVEQRWVCYAWCLDSNSIMVFDPCSLKYPPNGVVMMHKQIVSAIKSVMEEVGRKFILSWEHEWKAGSVTMLNMAVGADQWYVRIAHPLSFFFFGCCCLCCMQFDI